MQMVEHTRDEDGIPALDGSLAFELQPPKPSIGATGIVVGRGSDRAGRPCS